MVRPCLKNLVFFPISLEHSRTSLWSDLLGINKALIVSAFPKDVAPYVCQAAVMPICTGSMVSSGHISTCYARTMPWLESPTRTLTPLTSLPQESKASFSPFSFSQECTQSSQRREWVSAALVCPPHAPWAGAHSAGH